jgi:tetratricopeptide (TPR) repeat protein
MHNAGVRLAIRIAAVVLAILGFNRFVRLPSRAAHVIVAVEARSQRAIDAGDRGVVMARQNVELLRQIEPVSRGDANFYMLYAVNARILNDSELAVKEYTAALQNADRRPEIYFERGMTLLGMGRVDAAAADLTHAARFNPWIVYDLSGELQDRVKAGAGIP